MIYPLLDLSNTFDYITVAIVCQFTKTTFVYTNKYFAFKNVRCR
ncbi:hypothetical protein SAMN04487860_101269 [Ruminococcus flavefaciens]|uniref:Uncharacterized protein n=1 Tax=Ruminococcus flavefaciens TaxID=1265 RepID=A0A1M7GFQ3_RUMFL|nr:hypothetical protein SAMN04487860_101269 [Ruminococcus flavefaciens]